jgi:hypothetical protein
MRSAMFLGLGAWAFTWGAVLINGTPARANLPGGVFAATVSGAVEARPRGDAVFGLVQQPGAPAAFSITLTSPGSEGAVVLTGRSGERPLPGRTYRITEIGEGGAFQALYLAGSAEWPMGVFHATNGTLEVLAAGPDRIEARFRLDARGFLATEPEQENRRIAVTGWFTAESRSVAVSSAGDHAARLP